VHTLGEWAALRSTGALFVGGSERDTGHTPKSDWGTEDGGVYPVSRNQNRSAGALCRQSPARDQSLQPRGGSVMFFTATPMTLFSLPSTLRK